MYLTNTPGSGAWLDELQLVGETNYIYFNGKRTARRDPSGTVHYYLSDHLGSTSMVVSAAGTVENESEYYPWGGELKFSANDTSNHYKFTGKERDVESGLDYFGARYYGNTLGRFLTPDWAANATAVPYANFGNPQSLILYTYVKNNPTTLGDPDGHDVACALACKREQAVQQEVKVAVNLIVAAVTVYVAVRNFFSGQKENSTTAAPGSNDLASINSSGASSASNAGAREEQ